MSINLADLKKAWLRAETMADAAKQTLMCASLELEKRRGGSGKAAREFKKLLSFVERAKVRQEEAERAACAAFDRLWQAQAPANGQAQWQAQAPVDGQAQRQARARSNGQGHMHA
ncbi:MAG: hypothetical protein ACREC6_07565 [Hyphomicrobiaceae bacterium]